VTAAVHLAALVPTYDNPQTVGAVVSTLRRHVADVLLVDDGSAEAGRAACADLAASGLAIVHRLERNQGKGAALKAGFRLLHERGFTHALQVDADGQHDLTRVPAFVEAARQAPGALVLAYPEYDHSAPALRLLARRFTRFWVDLEVGGKGVIRDALIGFRVYPLAQTMRIGARGNRMEYEVEIAVRMARAGVPIVNLPVGVRYLAAAEGGISHFRPVADNLRLALMHSRLCSGFVTAWMLDRLLPHRRRTATR